MNRIDPHPFGTAADSTLAAALRGAAAELNATALPDGLQARVMQAATAVLPAALPAGPSCTSGATPSSALPGVEPVALPGGPAWARWLRARPRKPGSVAAPGSWWAWSGAAACTAVLCGTALLIARMPSPPVQEDDAGMGRFFLLVPPERWPAAGASASAWLVSTELPSERLAVLGLPYDPAHAGDTVRAELLLHPSGEVLAVRFAR